MNTVLYRIYTENKNKELILEETDAMLGGYTVYEAQGCWQDESEDSLIIESLLEDCLENEALIKTLAGSIKHLNKQESVLIIKQSVQSIFV